MTRGGGGVNQDDGGAGNDTCYGDPTPTDCELP
jgi:hypothetical protein